MRGKRWSPIVGTLLITAQLSGCTTWRVERVSPAQLVEQEHPSRIRVKRSDGRREVWYRPTVVGDSLQGSSSETRSRPDRIVALADVASVSTHHFSAGKTLGLGLGITAVAAIAAGIALASWDGPLGGCCQ
jgi:hypothetical protein